MNLEQNGNFSGDDTVTVKPAPHDEISTGLAVIAAIIIVGLLIFSVPFIYAEIAPSGGDRLQTIKEQVAHDQEQQYDMMGDDAPATDKCVHAGLVMEAYLQAHDEYKFITWKYRRERDCSAAGLSNF